MPTPSGKLKAGDRVRHKPTGMMCTVVKREGNDVMYSVILRPDDPHALRGTNRVMDHPGCFRLLEADYWMRNTYEIVT